MSNVKNKRKSRRPRYGHENDFEKAITSAMRQSCWDKESVLHGMWLALNWCDHEMTWQERKQKREAIERRSRNMK